MSSPSISAYRKNVKNSLPVITFARRRNRIAPTDACLTSDAEDDSTCNAPMPMISGSRRRNTVDVVPVSSKLQNIGISLSNPRPKITEEPEVCFLPFNICGELTIGRLEFRSWIPRSSTIYSRGSTPWVPFQFYRESPRWSSRLTSSRRTAGIVLPVPAPLTLD